MPGLTTGARAMVGAGAAVTRSVPPGVTVVGNPARTVGSMGRPHEGASQENPSILQPQDASRPTK